MPSAQTVATLVICVLALIHASTHSAAQVKSANQEPPARDPGVPAVGCKLGGSVAYIPSKGVGPEGLAVRISPPAKPRYPDGAPIAVQMTPDPLVIRHGCVSTRVASSTLVLSAREVKRVRLAVGRRAAADRDLRPAWRRWLTS